MTTNDAPTPIAEILESGRDQGSQPLDPSSSPVQDNTRQPAADADTTGDPADTADREPKWVPIQALHKERDRRKALTNRIRELEEENRVSLDAQYSQPAGYQEQGQPGPVQYGDDPRASVAALAQSTILRSSRAEFVAEHGKAAFQEFDDALDRAMQSGHPQLLMAAQAAQRSDDPVGVLHEWAQRNGLLPEPGGGQQSAQTFPSNFANVRNVGPRRGPAWGGPMPMTDIFNRKRASK